MQLKALVAEPERVATQQDNQEAKERFNQLMKEKKDKGVNKDLAGFIANTQKKAMDMLKASNQPTQVRGLGSGNQVAEREVKRADPSEKVP